MKRPALGGPLSRLTGDISRSVIVVVVVVLAVLLAFRCAAAEVRLVLGAPTAFVDCHLRICAERARARDALRRLVVHVLHSDDALGRDAFLDPLLQCAENVVLRRVAERLRLRQLLAEGIWPGTAAAVKHPWCDEQAEEVARVVVLASDLAVVVDRVGAEIAGSSQPCHMMILPRRLRCVKRPRSASVAFMVRSVLRSATPCRGRNRSPPSPRRPAPGSLPRCGRRRRCRRTPGRTHPRPGDR